MKQAQMIMILVGTVRELAELLQHALLVQWRVTDRYSAVQHRYGTSASGLMSYRHPDHDVRPNRSPRSWINRYRE